MKQPSEERFHEIPGRWIRYAGSKTGEAESRKPQPRACTEGDSDEDELICPSCI